MCAHKLFHRLQNLFLLFDKKYCNSSYVGPFCLNRLLDKSDDDVVLRHTLPVFTGLGRCPIASWDFVGAVSIFGPDALPVVHQ